MIFPVTGEIGPLAIDRKQPILYEKAEKLGMGVVGNTKKERFH